MNRDAPGVSASIQHLVIESAALIAPCRYRKEWLLKWNSELWYVRHEASAGKDIWWFCLGAFGDALSTRRDCPKESVVSTFNSPLSCVTLLSSLALLFFLATLLLPAARHTLLLDLHTKSSLYWLHSWTGVSEFPPNHVDQQIVIFRLTFIFAFAILPAVTTLRFGVNTRSSSPRSRLSRFRGLAFFMLKVVLISLLVYFAALGLRYLLVPAGGAFVQEIASLAGFVLSLRWVFNDQRQRCPTCLYHLDNPVRIGRPSWILLDWNRLECLCPKGHGVLCVPAESVSGSFEQTWISTDSFWSELLQNQSHAAGQS
jgi:hypothetical protein